MKEINEMDTIFDSMDKQKMQQKRKQNNKHSLVTNSRLEQIVEEDQADKSKEQITARVYHSDLPSDQSIPL